MNLLRYGPNGAEKPGLLDEYGAIRDLSSFMSDIGPELFSGDALGKLAAMDLADLPVVHGAPRLGVPVTGVRKFIGIGLNYADHSSDAEGRRPLEPVIFMKAITCLNGPNDDIMLPRDARMVDWEVELGVLIGRKARYVRRDEALAHLAGYVLVNDVSDRGFQNSSGQWDKGKGCDTFGPVGPWLVTADEIADPQNIDLRLQLNGKLMQSGNTRNMIFPVADLIANVSTYVTLEPGDLIATGTPRGVGADQKPEPVFLKAGDSLTLDGGPLGRQVQNVVEWQP